MTTRPDPHENLRLAYWWLRRLGYHCRVSREDREQTAVVGLIESLKTYDSTKGALSVWAAYFIKTELWRQRQKFRRVVSYPVKGSLPKRALLERWSKGEISATELVAGTRVRIRNPEHLDRLVGLVTGHDVSDGMLADTLEDHDTLDRIEGIDPLPLAKRKLASVIRSVIPTDVLFKYMQSELKSEGLPMDIEMI